MTTATASPGERRRRLNTLREVYDEFLRRNPPKNTRWRKVFIPYIDEFTQVKGDIAIDELIDDDLEQFIEDHPTWKSGWTRMNVSRVLKRPLFWAWRKGLIDRLPFRGVSYRPGERGKPMTEENFRALLRGTTAEFRRVLLFLWWTGCRPCELASLQWKFINTELGVAVLHEHKTAHSRKDREARTICLPEKATRLLTWLLDDQRDEDSHVFLNSRGEPWKVGALQLRLFRARKRLGIPPDVGLYGCRHSFGTRMALAGVELKTLATLMGHTTTTMSEHYVHMAGQIEHLHKALEKGLAGKPKKRDGDERERKAS